MRALARLIAMTLAVGWCSIANAQRAVVVLENDAIAKTDRDYTSGFRGSLVFDLFSKEPLAAQAFDFFRPALLTIGAPVGPVQQQIEWIVLGQSIFTPDHNTPPYRPFVDRPYSGWLYTGAAISEETARTQLDTFEVLVGVVGPGALGTQVQDAFHRWLGQTQPVVAGYELSNEPGILVSWDRRWKFGSSTADGYGFDIIPSAGLTAGNVFTYATAGAIARAGRSLSTTWGPTLVRPARSGASFISRDPDMPFWGFDVFAGAEGRAVARNIFLDGNTFETSPHVTRKPLVFDLIVGAELFTQSGFQLGLTAIQRSREYSTQSKPSTYGALNASLRF